MTASHIDYVVMGVYLVFLIVMGWAIKKFNTNVSDYFRGGCKGTWWLVGSSMFISAISARTFTASSGVAFEEGWTVTNIFIANVFAGLFTVLLAGRFRRIRATTGPEVVRMRYGVGLELFYSYFGIFLGLLGGGTILWALAIFCSAVFGLGIQTTTIVLGLVVLFYSCSGGKWAVMAADFLQSLIMIPITVLIAILCLHELGGVSGMFQTIEAQGLTEQFALVKPYDASKLGNYAMPWVASIYISQIIFSLTLGAATRFFAVKDEREARMAAWLNTGLCIIGVLVWFVPPIAARLLFPEAVTSLEISKPAEAAYAVASMKMLPVGLMGIMVVAMFATTTSTMDTALNGLAGVVVVNIYPNTCRALKINPMRDEKLLAFSRWMTILFGMIVIGIALYFANSEGVGMFEVMLNITALLGVPTVIPSLMGLYVRRTPFWSGLFSIGVAFIPAFFAHCGDKGWFGFSPWPYHMKIFVVLGVGVSAYLFTMLFWKYEKPKNKQQINDFFDRLHTPIDFAREVGTGNDAMQLKFIGGFASALAILFLFLLIVSHTLAGIICVLSLSAFIGSFGILLYRTGVKMEARLVEAGKVAPQADQDLNN